MTKRTRPASDPRPAYYDCGICGSLHPATWDGDCRDDASRFACDELDTKHGPFGWRESEMPTWETA